MQKYAGDIDVMQKIVGSSVEEVIYQFTKSIKDIVSHLDKSHIFSEFKAGIDKSYDIDIGYLQNGLYHPNPLLIDTLRVKHNAGLFTSKEYQSIITSLSFIKTVQLNSIIYDFIHELIRNKKTLRWTKEEILQGYKMISTGKYFLEEALKDKTVIKIDLIAYIDKKFIEITNVVLLGYKNGKKLTPINAPDTKFDFPEVLKKDIEKLYYSDKFYSPLKACKRIFSLIRITKDYQDLIKVTKLIRGEISLLYQIKADLETLITVLEKSNIDLISQVHYVLQNIKNRLNYVLEYPQENIVQLSNDINQLSKITNVENLIDGIKTLKNIIKEDIEVLTISRMDEMLFNPFPEEYLPNISTYSRHIVRKPDSLPTVQYDKWVELFN